MLKWLLRSVKRDMSNRTDLGSQSQLGSVQEGLVKLVSVATASRERRMCVGYQMGIQGG